jgi:signal transduction histidine kinase
LNHLDTNTPRIILWTLVILATPFLAWNGIVQGWNDSACDVLARMLPKPQQANLDRIVLLAIDDATAGRHGPLPLKRDLLARGLAPVAAAKPAVLVVDLLLAETTDADAELAAVLARFPVVVLGAALEAGASPQWILPRDVFPRAALGHVHASPDPDGVVRTILLLKAAGQRHLPALALEAAFRFGLPVALPAPQEGRALWIRYAGGEGTFRTVPFARVLNGEARAADFAGRIVILGVSAQGAGDRRFTPVSSGLDMPGIEIHANAVRTLLDGDFLQPLAPFEEFALLLATVAGLYSARRRRWTLYTIPLLIPVAGYAALLAGWILPVAAWLLCAIAAALAAAVTAAREAQAGREDYALRLQAIAHEIKTPLTAIQASSEMIAAADIPEERKALVAGLIHKESRRLAGIVNAFLDVERISAGVLKLERRPADLAEIASEAIERAELVALKKRIRIESELQPAPVSADAELLGFAVYNLLTNAIKYSPRDSVVQVVTAPGMLSVADRGEGIEPSEQARVFERFYRQKAHRQGAQPGAGVGLALVKEIVTQHGGSIEVESVPGRGSRFTIRLPSNQGW